MSGLMYCNACRRETHWKRLRGGRREKCLGCATTYPCRGECQHLDCRATRAELAAGGAL